MTGRAPILESLSEPLDAGDCLRFLETGLKSEQFAAARIVSASFSNSVIVADNSRVSGFGVGFSTSSSANAADPLALRGT